MDPARLAGLLLLTLMCTSAIAATLDNDKNNGHGHHNNQGNNCKDCEKCKHNDNGCNSNCKKDCKQEGGINVEKCKAYGNDAGYNAARAACELTQKYCRGGRSVGAPQRTKVSLQQCGNAAYGVCQSKAMDPKQSPCGGAFRGENQCNQNEFMTFYTGEVDWNCNQATAAFDKN